MIFVNLAPIQLPLEIQREVAEWQKEWKLPLEARCQQQQLDPS